MTENAIRRQVRATAAAYLGAKEGSAKHKEIVEIFNSHKPHPRGYVLQMTDAWCAGFVSAIAIKLKLTDIIPVECSCSKMIQLFKDLGCWKEADNYTPQPGDVIFYDWQDDGKGDNTGAPDHVGYVDNVEGGEIYVTEGNYRDAVGTRKIKVNARYIRGYGLPDYASKADNKTVNELAQEVIKGLWDNGAARRAKLTAAGYDAKAVQDRVNELVYGCATYTVKEGDTLWDIAEKELGDHNRFPEIMKLNGLKSDVIYPDQVLKMPEK